MARIGKKAHFMRRARNQRRAAGASSGTAREARLQIAHGFDTLAHTARGSTKKTKKKHKKKHKKGKR